MHAGIDVENDGEQVDAGHAVDHAVVNLRDERPLVVGEALDQPDLPQGAATVEALRHEPGHEGAQFGVVARPGESGVANVVADVEMLVIDPHGPTELERHGLHHLAIPRE